MFSFLLFSVSSAFGAVLDHDRVIRARAQPQRGKISFVVDGSGELHKQTVDDKLGLSVSGFDCDAGYDNFERGWSQSKLKYCCWHYVKGCLPDMLDELARASAQHRPGGGHAGIQMTYSDRFVLRRHSARADPSRSSAASFAKTSVSAPPIPPGFAFLGNGYDMLVGNPLSISGTGDPGWKSAVFAIDGSTGKVTFDGKWTIPEGAESLPFKQCSYQLDGRTINSAYAYQQAEGNGFNLGGTAYGVKFQFGIEAQHVSRTTLNKESIYTTSMMECVIYQLSLDVFSPPPLSQDFINGVNEFLPVTYDEEKYMYFIQQFGTSFVSNLKLGGRWGWMASFSYSDYTSFIQHGINVQASIGYMSQSKLNLNLGFNHTSNNTHTENVSSKIQQEAQFNTGGAFSSDSAVWLANVAALPMPVTFETSPLHYLLEEPHWMNASQDVQTKKTLLQGAISNYCKFLGKQMNITNPCTAPPSVPPFSIPPVPKDAVGQICITNQGDFSMSCVVSIPAKERKAPTKTFGKGEIQCMPATTLGAENGDVMTCSCSADGHTTECTGSGFPYWEGTELNGQYLCDGSSSSSISCDANGESTLDKVVNRKR